MELWQTFMYAFTKDRLVRNEAPAVQKKLQTLICNLLPKNVRIDQMEGKDFVVVPMVMLTEGVHNGSQGSLYYPPEELGKTPVSWNHKPVVVYHPEINGVGVSACDPNILTARKIGVIMNTKYDGGRLTAEAWLEKDRANKVDTRIMEAIDNNQVMELSTGVYVDTEATPGKWNTEDYSGIARNYRPDHLAILPDMIGACSVKDGAGFLRNAAYGGDPKKKKKSKLYSMMEAVRAALGVDTSNAMSYSNISSALYSALCEKLGTNKPDYSGGWCYIADVYSNFFIYESDGKLYRLSYSASDTGVTIGDETPVEVVQVTEYRTVDGGAYVGNQNKPQNTMNKKTLVDAIILAAAALGTWNEGDRERLMAMNEADLQLIQNKVGKAPTPPPVAPTAPAAPAALAPAANTTTATTTAAPAKELTLEEYIANAPAPAREVLQNGMLLLTEERTRLVDTICANKNNRFAKEDLQKRSVPELRSLAALAGSTEAPRTLNYSGQGSVPTTTNQEQPALPIPTLNFEPTKK